MSNEHTDWLRDQASDIMLDNGTLKNIEYCESFHCGYITIGEDYDWHRRVFFIWNDDLDGWSYREINP